MDSGSKPAAGDSSTKSDDFRSAADDSMQSDFDDINNIDPDQACKGPLPLTMPNGTRYNCGRLGNPCPANSTCVVQAGDAYAVCCQGNTVVSY